MSDPAETLCNLLEVELGRQLAASKGVASTGFSTREVEISTTTLVDQTCCFNAKEWNFQYALLRGLNSRLAIYTGVVGMESFGPFQARLGNLAQDYLREAASFVPPV